MDRPRRPCRSGAQHGLVSAVVPLRGRLGPAGQSHLLAVDPQHTLTHMALAVHLQKLDRPEEAIEHAQKVVELQPDDAFSFMQLSVVLQRCGKIPEAEEAMFRARQIQMGG